MGLPWDDLTLAVPWVTHGKDSEGITSLDPWVTHGKILRSLHLHKMVIESQRST